MTDPQREQARRRIARLAGQSLDLISFWREAAAALAPAVPFYVTPCWYTLDPASLLVTSHFQEGMPEIPPEWLAQEYLEDDVNKLADVARSERGLATLLEATGGDPRRSPRYERDMVPYGAEQELVVGLRTRAGEIWGALGLYREPGQPPFDAAELVFMQAVAPDLAEGARRGLLVGEATDPESPDAPGLVVLGRDWQIETATPGALRWLAELPDGDLARGELPAAVLSVGSRALRSASDDEVCPDAAIARVRSRSGRWLVLHGSTLGSGSEARAAVIVEAAGPARIAPLLMAAYGLTEREQDVTRLVLQGCSTAEIAERLFISGHTVQQHLKRVFEKTGVRSRRDLVAALFLAHYEPRVRDNEARVLGERFPRGGPLARSAAQHVAAAEPPVAPSFGPPFQQP